MVGVLGRQFASEAEAMEWWVKFYGPCVFEIRPNGQFMFFEGGGNTAWVSNAKVALNLVTQTSGQRTVMSESALHDLMHAV